MNNSRTFRVFVSSTFSDLKAERNALQEKVYPRLRDLASAHGCRFQAIDLRWGVSEEAALDQQTMKICLGEIERCQEISPRPNFVILLGDRYGWRPLAAEIPDDEYQKIQPLLPEEIRSLFMQWYRLDENAVPQVYTLQPRTGDTINDQAWNEAENHLQPAMESAAIRAGLTPEALIKYTSSATEQEIVAGALKVPDASEHVFGFFRNIEKLNQNDKAKDFIDLNGIGEINTDAKNKLQVLKNRLKDLLGRNIHEYSATWQVNDVDHLHIEKFCEDVYQALEGVIMREILLLEQVDSLDHEIALHESYKTELASDFMGRQEQLNSLSEYLTSQNTRPFFVWGESGCGKSALLARSSSQASKIDQPPLVIIRFIGVTPTSSSRHAFLTELCRQIYRDCDFEIQKQRQIEADPEHAILIESEYEIPENPYHLEKKLDLFLKKIPENIQVLFYLDGLDQLLSQPPDESVRWLPACLPPNIKIVCSTTPGTVLQLLRRDYPESSFLEIPSMPIQEGEALLDAWLLKKRRKLSADQHRIILTNFENCRLPLFLRLASEEAGRWKSYEGIPELGKNVSEILCQFFDHLSKDRHHGGILVSRSLGYLAASRNGLAEDELLDILSRDSEVLADFYKRSPRSPKVNQLPVIIWLRLRSDLESFLVERKVDGSVLITLFHHQVREVITGLYLEKNQRDYHQSLADYFEQIQTYQGEFSSSQRTFELRKLSEYVWQLNHAENWSKITEVLCDLVFLEAKCAAGLTQDLLQDYRMAFDGLPEIETEREAEREKCTELQKYADELVDYNRKCNELLISNDVKGLAKLNWNVPIPKHCDPLNKSDDEEIQAETSRLGRLRSFYTFIESEADHLSTAADLPLFLVQQANNSADRGPVVEAAKAVLNQAHGNVPLFIADPPRLQFTSHPECRFSIQDDHSKFIKFTANGQIAVSAGRKGLAVWEIPSGKCLKTFGEEHDYDSLSLSADGRRAALTNGREILIYDVTGMKLEKKIYPEFSVGSRPAICISPDGRFLLYSDEYGKLLILKDIDTNRTVRWFGHPSSTSSSLGSSDAEKKNVLRLGKPENFKSEIISAALPNDSRTVVSSHKDGTIRIWEMVSGKCRHVLKGYQWAIYHLEISGDGKKLFTGTPGANTKQWDLENGKCIQTISTWGNALSVSADGNLLLLAGKNLCVWDVRAGVLKRNYRYSASSTSLSADGRFAISTNKNGFNLFDVEYGKPRHILGNLDFKSQIMDFDCKEDGSQVLVSHSDKVIIYDSKNLTPILTFPIKDSSNTFFSRDESKIYNAKPDNKGRLESYQAGTGVLLASTEFEVRDFRGNGPRVRVEQSLDGRMLRLLNRPVDLDSPSRTVLPDEGTSYRCALSADGRLIATRIDTQINLWDAYSGLRLINIYMPEPGDGYMVGGHNISLSPDGSFLIAMGLMERKASIIVRIFETTQGNCLHSLEFPRKNMPYLVEGPFFSTDPEKFWLRVRQKEMQQWNAGTGVCLKEFPFTREHFILSENAHYAVTSNELWDMEQGLRIAKFWYPYGGTNFFQQKGNYYYAVDVAGDLLRFEIRNTEHKNTELVPVRIWKSGNKNGQGSWHKNLSVRCEHCLKLIDLITDTNMDKFEYHGDPVCSYCGAHLRLASYRVDPLKNTKEYPWATVYDKDWVRKANEYKRHVLEEYQKNHLEQALKWVCEAEKYYRVFCQKELGSILYSKASILYKLGKSHEAVRPCEEAQGLLEIADRNYLIYCLQLKSIILQAEGDLEAAESTNQYCLSICYELKDDEGVQNCKVRSESLKELH